MKRFVTPLLALAIFLVNVWLSAPLFMPGELPFRGSIEGGYVGMARFLSEHPNPWGWNPLAYGGLPVQFMYVPVLPYVSAFWIWLLPYSSPDTVYRIIVSLLTCLGPVTLFWFALRFTGSRRWALAAALAYTVFSPSYGLFPAVEKDRGIVQLPWRVQLLAKYGEGPHNTGLTLLPLALLGVWLAGKSRKLVGLVPAAIILALIPLTNWVAALALAISCLLLLLAAWGEPDFQMWRALAAAAFAYLLACFWLTPSFIQTIVFNWPGDSFGYRFGAMQMKLLAGMLGGIIAIRLLFRLLHGSFYFCLVTLGAFVFGWLATAHYVYGIDTIPESRRYAIEFELFLVLALAEATRLAMRSANGTVRLCAIGAGGVMLLAGTPQLWAYATQGWQVWHPVPKESTVEYQLARWIAEHPPEGRVYASGGLRFRLNSWFDIPQVGGGFETGLQNRVPVDLAYRIRTAADSDSLLELKALGAEYVVVHGPKSREYYRDLVQPERIVANLPPVHRIEDDAIYALPRRGLAHLVQAEELDELPRYVSAIEDAARPSLNLRWTGSSSLTIGGPVRSGDLVSVQVNADPGWRARQNGREIELSKDPRGFLVAHPTPAESARIDLHYAATAEPRVLAAVSALAWCAALFLTITARRRRISDTVSGNGKSASYFQ